MAVHARFLIADVFTDTPLAGNRLGVFTDARALDDAQMLALTRELGFSECVFVLSAQAGGHARVRIFTPAHEIPFAGHPVLGAAFALGAPMQAVVLRLETGSGIVPVTLEREGARIVFAWMEQPVPAIAPIEDEAGLLAALGVERAESPVEVYDNGLRHAMVRLASVEAVEALDPDMRRLAALGDLGVSCFAGDGLAWTTRMFAPAHGVDEDPATGSAAGPLAAHLARHGAIAFGEEIVISQGASVGRPSVLHARVSGTPDAIERVEVGGSAVIVARGEFAI